MNLPIFVGKILANFFVAKVLDLNDAIDFFDKVCYYRGMIHKCFKFTNPVAEAVLNYGRISMLAVDNLETV